MGDIWSFFVMFRPDFVDRMIPNGLDDTRRTRLFCDFWQEKFVMVKSYWV